MLGLKRSLNSSRVRELMPSAATTRSAPRIVILSGSASEPYLMSMPSECARRPRIFSSIAREVPQKPLPPMRWVEPRKWISMSSQ